MDHDFIRFGLAAFVTLLVVVDTPGFVPISVALTKDEQPARRRRILIRAVLIALAFVSMYLGARLIALLGEGGGPHCHSRNGNRVGGASRAVCSKRHHRLLHFAHVSLKTKANAGLLRPRTYCQARSEVLSQRSGLRLNEPSVESLLRFCLRPAGCASTWSCIKANTLYSWKTSYRNQGFFDVCIYQS